MAILRENFSSFYDMLTNGFSSFFFNTGILFSSVSIALGVLLYIKQDTILYIPVISGIPRRPGHNPRRYRSPEEHGIPFESHMIQCSDGVKINAWFLDRALPNRPTLIFFHGNAGNIGLRLPNALKMYQYLDANILLVEYRGYGDSDTAKINEAGLKLDAEASLRFLREEKKEHPSVDVSKVFIFGRSLGGAVAFHLAQYAENNNIPLAGVIVENTFLGIPEMVDTLMPYIAPMKFLILRMFWRSSHIVPSLTSPILYLAGKKDELVPHDHMLKLYDTSKLSRLVRLHIVKNGTHNETWLQGGEEYYNKIKQFIEEALSLSSANGCKVDGKTTAATVNIDAADAKSIPTMSSNILGMLGGGRVYDSTTEKKEK